MNKLLVEWFAEYKAIVFSITISIAAFLLFLAGFAVHEYFEGVKQLKQEHQVIQAVYQEESVLLHDRSISVPELPKINGVSLAEAFNEEFATEECLILANEDNAKLRPEWLAIGNITVFDDEWYEEVSKVANFQQTLFAEGYFGVIRISRPCYNKAGDRAILYLERDCGVGCGSGEVVLLVLEAAGWRRFTERIIWVG